MSKLKVRIPNFPGKDILAKRAGRTAMKISKHSPEILVGVGIVGGIGATVLACRATLHVEEVLKTHEETMSRIKEVFEKKDEYPDYTPEKVTRDKCVTTIKTVAAIGKLYGPAVIVGGVSIASIVGGHYILNKRYVGVTAAYAALQEAYKGYRRHIAEEFGEEKELELYHGVREKLEQVEGKNGKIKEIKKKVIDPKGGHSIYARVFDETNSWYKKNPTMNRMFLEAQQAHANDLLKINGHLFLNDVYRMLGFPDTSYGAVVGWIYGYGDSFIDFDIFDLSDPGKVEFINGYERAIWLDFNVDGVIYDLI